MTSPDFARSRNYSLWVPASANEFFSETLAILKLLRPEERINQIAHDKERHDQSNKIFQSHDASPLKTIAATDIQACDYKKNHRDDDKYNVSHTIAPENRLACNDRIASTVPAVLLRNNYFSKELPGCKLQEQSIEPLQVARTRSTYYKY
jgi:hypothetical protein